MTPYNFSSLIGRINENNMKISKRYVLHTKTHLYKMSDYQILERVIHKFINGPDKEIQEIDKVEDYHKLDDLIKEHRIDLRKDIMKNMLSDFLDAFDPSWEDEPLIEVMFLSSKILRHPFYDDCNYDRSVDPFFYTLSNVNRYHALLFPYLLYVSPAYAFPFNPPPGQPSIDTASGSQVTIATHLFLIRTKGEAFVSDRAIEMGCDQIEDIDHMTCDDIETQVGFYTELTVKRICTISNGFFVFD